MNGQGATIKIAEKFAKFSEHWTPHIIADLNDSHVKLAKLSGEFVWHSHADEDELFLVTKGTLRIKLRDHELTIREGEFAVIPKGVEHLPIADDEVHVLLIEPKSTKHTGDIQCERTVDVLKRI